jgi:hypothetical protein
MNTSSVSSSVSSSVNSVMNSSGEFTGLQTFAIFSVVVIITIGIGYLVFNYEYATSPWWSDRFYATKGIFDWLNFQGLSTIGPGWFGLNQAAIPFSLSQSSVLNDISNRGLGEKGKPNREFWCFVGEDFTGRYCVKVPGPKSFDRDRSYWTRLDCELHLANALPAGVITDNGVKYDPLYKGITGP